MKIQHGLASNAAARFAFTKVIATFVEEGKSRAEPHHHQGRVHGFIQNEEQI
jgi:hypothetical protein